MRRVLRDPHAGRRLQGTGADAAQRGLRGRAAARRRPAAHPRRARGDGGADGRALHDDWAGAFEQHQVRGATGPTRAAAGARWPTWRWPCCAGRRGTDGRRPCGPAAPTSAQGRRQHDRPPRRAGRRWWTRMPSWPSRRWPASTPVPPRGAGARQVVRPAGPAPERDGRVFARAKAAAAAPRLHAEEPEPRAQPAAWRCACTTRRPSTAPTPAATCSGPTRCELDAINPQLAARLARAMDRWRAPGRALPQRRARGHQARGRQAPT
jgi:aminopeptidase N